ncbi:uncharacterized protein A1O5_10224 [Cladophialophora psammophila CBS 110553]|uniref:TauD/TfdA-like domain-containing protein n=1 Tax=Cladophialophora psammophila CBS 110553 TaxID=1182543 RepID=W9WNH8_9EURO|nr:uncharacterized protein A1O5_10224 [Cladophialophora psammophila CBS 110553]EXJ66555.1 hypothetical protein A1O5_10224 [Cladophialophora psammophila CBS 110553]
MSPAHTGITEQVLSYKAPDPPVKEFEPAPDRAIFADPDKKSLLAACKQVRKLTPYVGTELVGIQLSQLTDAQKDELALLVAERGVVFFRDQDLRLEQQYALTAYYGIVSEALPERHSPSTTTGRPSDIRKYADYGGEYHSDHSHEANPPAYTMLRMIRTPESGGDTVFTSQTALYDKLSPTFQRLFDGLHAVHSSESGFVNSINGGYKPFRGPQRRDHPLVRTHPVTRLKSLFYNPTFVIHIRELKAQESIHTLNFLREHLHAADDLTVRWKWEPGSVAFWDNRVVVHRAIPGGYDPATREGKRTAIFGEKPFFDPENSQTLSERIRGMGGPEAQYEETNIYFNSPHV